MDDEIKYYLVKVLPSAKTITSNYGDMELDEEMRGAVVIFAMFYAFFILLWAVQ